MKLSLKFREETQTQPLNPLLRAKIPVTILGIPFLSGLTAGDPSDLSFSLRSNFSSGPSLSLSYHPTLNYLNTPTSTHPPHCLPFSISLKSGLGLSGSHKDSPLVFTANFNLFNNSSNPTFSLQVKPQFGNFSLSKSVHSGRVGPNRVDGVSRNRVVGNGSGSDVGISDGFDQPQFVGVGRGYNGNLGKSGSIRADGVAQNVVLSSGSGFESEGNNGLEKPLGWRDLRIDSVGSGSGFLSGIFVAARTCLPLTKRAVVNFRWGVNFPPEGSVSGSGSGSGSRSSLPMLVVNKVSLERVDEEKKMERVEDGKMGDLELLKGMCGWMSREVEDLQRENREMRQVLEGMKVDVSSSWGGRADERGGGGRRGGALPVSDNSSEFERWRSRKGTRSGVGEENRNKESKKLSNNSKMSEVENELQKAIKNASS